MITTTTTIRTTTIAIITIIITIITIITVLVLLIPRRLGIQSSLIAGIEPNISKTLSVIGIYSILIAVSLTIYIILLLLIGLLDLR